MFASKTNRTHRFLAMALVLCMVLGMFTMGVSAAECAEHKYTLVRVENGLVVSKCYDCGAVQREDYVEDEANTYKALYFDFQTEEGWTGQANATPSNELSVWYGGSAEYGKLALIPGHQYKLTFTARGDVDGSGFMLRVADYDENDNALKAPWTLNEFVAINADYALYEYRFVANSTGDDAYAYSTLSLDVTRCDELLDRAGKDYWKGSAWFDTMALVDLGVAAENQVGNPGFEAPLAANGYSINSQWDPALHLEAGNGGYGWLGYEGNECLSFVKDGDARLTPWGTYSTEEMTLEFWGKYVKKDTATWTSVTVDIIGYDAGGNVVAEEELDTFTLSPYNWESYRVNYKKPANVNNYRFAFDINGDTTWYRGTLLDHISLRSTSAAAAVTPMQVATAAPIEKYADHAHDYSVFVKTVEPTAEAQGYTTYKCALCEETENRDFTNYVGPIDATFTHTGNALELEGIVYINNYSKISGFESTDYVEENGGLLIWKNAVTEEEATFENAEDVNPGLVYDSKYDEFLSMTDGIPTKEFADELYLRIYVKGEDGNYYYGELKPYSVKEYCEGRIAKSTSAKMKALAAQMLHYGAAAQNYFSYNLDNLANADITVEAETYDAALINALTPYFSAPQYTVDANVKTNGNALTLVGAILVDFYFKAPADYTDGVLQVWDNTTELTEENFYEVPMEYDSKAKEWHGQSNGIFAKYYGKTIYARAKFIDADGQACYSEIVSYSVEEYAKGRIEKSTNAKMVELAKNLVIYGERARDYFGVEEEVVYIPVDPTADSEYVVQDNLPKAHIMLTEDATELEKYAAEELQLHAKMVTGATLPITELNPAEKAFTATAEPSVVYADKNGYYPVQFILKNPTAAAMSLTLRQKADTAETEPALTIRGDNGNDGVVYLDPHSQLAVSGHFSVGDVYAYPHSTVEVEILQNGEVIETAEVNFAARASAVNGTFEDGNAGWATGTASTTAAHTGSRSLRANKATEVKTNPVKLISGHTYYLSFYSKTTIDGMTVDVKVSDYNASGTALRTPMSFNTVGIKMTTDWTRFEGRFIANTSGDAEYAYSVLSFMNNATAGSYFDDIQLIDCGEMPEEETKNGELENYDASGYPTNWWTGVFGIEDANTFYTGSKSMHVTATNGLGYGGFNAKEANTTYAVSFWAKAQNTSATVTFTADPYVSSVSNETRVTQSFTLSEEWQRFELVFKTPEVAEGVLYNGTYLTFGSTGSFWMDHFRVHDVDEAVAVQSALQQGTPSGGTMPAEPAIPAPANNDLTIVIATPDSYPDLKQLFADDLTWLGDSDGFAIRQLRGTIYIFGNESRGTLNGVYDFIEDNFDVIWFRANDTAYRAQSSVKPAVNYREKSPFAVRSWHMGGTGKNGEIMDDWDTDVMLSRNRLNARNGTYQNSAFWENWETIGVEAFDNDHNLATLITGSPIYDANEVEYWNTDENGNYLTVAGGATDPLTYNINFYSQKTVDAVAAKILADLKKDPDRKYYSVGMHDTSYFVNKPYSDQAFEYASGKSVQPSASNYKSTVFFTWLNKIAAKVGAQYPDVKITTMAYSFNQYAPACDVADNIQIIFAPLRENYKERLDTTDTGDANYRIYQDLQDWMKKTSNIVVYSYFGYAYPGAAEVYMRPIGGKIQSDLQFYAEHGFGGMNPEGCVDYNSNNWAMNSLTYWLYHKFTWDPYADIDELTEHFCTVVYGDAASYMMEYYDLLQQAWDNSSVDYNIDFELADYLENYVTSAGTEHVNSMHTALNNAYDAVSSGSVYRDRIAYIRDTFISNTTPESSDDNCIAPDTRITLADGSQVRVDALTGDEMLLVWNMETGMLDSAPILFVDSDPEAEFEVIHLYFSDGTDVKVISEHGFWDYDLNKYVYLDVNAAEYIGHTFAKQNGDALEQVQLTDVVMETECTTAWSPVTADHLCYFVNGMLSMPGGAGGLFNIFDVDPETMTYDPEAMARDIETYGLFTYDELNAIEPLPEEMFEAAGGAYLKISIGKGNLTMDELQAMIRRYSKFF